MSGPASGVIAAAATLAQSGVANAITYDMGGTSTDVALIHGGVPEVSSELTIDYGLPIHVPMVDVRTSAPAAARSPAINAAGMLQVGPQSRRLRAGADLLRPRRHAADHHRRQPGARPARSGAPAGGVDGRVRSTPVRARSSTREIAAAARPRRRGRGGGRHPARQHAHGRRDPHGVAVARLRSARFRAVRLRRRRAAARRGAGAASWAFPRCWCPRGPASPTRWAASSPTCARISSTRSTCRSTALDMRRGRMTCSRAQRAARRAHQRRRAGARSSRPSCCTAPTCSSAARRI